MVQEQEYSPYDPPSWFGYDYQGEPLTEQQDGTPLQDSDLTTKESTHSSEEEAV